MIKYNQNLFSRKIRARFQALMSSAIDQCRFKGMVQMLPHTADVVLLISNQIHIRIIPAFRCGGMWPRSAANWPSPECTVWPVASIVQQIKVSN